MTPPVASPPMLHITSTVLLNTAAWGILHALIPCAHSWPMLLPFARGRPLWVSFWFGLGFAISGTLAGASAGALMKLVTGGGHDTRAEEITGAILIALGALFLIKPRVIHAGHVHGEEKHAHEAGESCSHQPKTTRRLARLGPTLGVFLLGLLNVAIPCWTNVSALAFAGTSGGMVGGALVGAVFAISAALTMAVVLSLATRGLAVFERLGDARVEALILRLSGAVLVFFGLSLVFHWHDHSAH